MKDSETWSRLVRVEMLVSPRPLTNLDVFQRQSEHFKELLGYSEADQSPGQLQSAR